jgi:hypothetical protein
MLFYDVLRLLDDQVTPDRCKVHLAGWDGKVNPLSAYFAGEFDAWQSSQSQKNFERPMVVSLIALPGNDQWLFAGVYDSKGYEKVEPHGWLRYHLSRRPGPDELNGRLVVRFARPGRQSYLRGEKWNQTMHVGSYGRSGSRSRDSQAMRR